MPLSRVVARLVVGLGDLGSGELEVGDFHRPEDEVAHCWLVPSSDSYCHRSEG